MPKTDLRVVKTRSIIRNALLETLSEKHISRVTVSEICTIAKINRKTFYRHYRTVIDVMEELENELLGEFSKNLRSGSLLNIEAVIRGASETVKLHSDIFSRILKHNAEIFTDGRLKMALRRTIAAALKNNGSKSGDRELGAAAEFVVSGMLALYAEWFAGGCREDIDVLADISVKTAAGGLSAYLPEKK